LQSSKTRNVPVLIATVALANAAGAAQVSGTQISVQVPKHSATSRHALRPEDQSTTFTQVEFRTV
jgi:hypothetical protein